MRTVLLVAAVILALIAALLDFGVFDSDTPHAFGWLALAVGCFAGSFLVND